MNSPLPARPQPLVETMVLDLSPPTLHDNTADLDRVVRELKAAGFEPLQVHVSNLNHLVHSIRRHQYRVKAVLSHWGEYWELMDVLPRDHDRPLLGVAVDLGTTSLAFYLVDLQAGTVLDELSVKNPQIEHGEDILTRILFSREERNRKLLQDMLVKRFNEVFAELTGRNGGSPGDVRALSVAGNTTMSHFFLGLDATRICKEPYIPAVNRFPRSHGRDLGLSLNPFAPVYVFPNVGSYFGGDLLAGILATGLHRSREIRLLVDVGTNAEVVLGNRDWLIACAGAAGPALEGGVMECGMMALPGAIDRVRIDRSTFEPEWHVLGDGKPRGVCGSGVIDLVAEMFGAGILTVQGKINTGLKSHRVVQTADGPAYILAHGSETEDGRDLLVTEVDIGIFLKSKAAMYTILNVICNKVGVAFKDLRKIYVAGTFGNHIDPAMAVRIGMIPDLPLDVYEGVGNSAGEGAVNVLLDRSLPVEVQEICSRITYVELNVNMELMNEFRGALFLPHTDPRLFPSVEIPAGAQGKGVN